MTDALSAINPFASQLTAQAAPPRAEQFGKDTFLKLLVAQLKYQDPTSPTDGAEFLAQTAQFTVVEKLEELAKTNAELLTAERLTTATSLIGRHVTYTNSEGTEATGVVTATRIGPLGPSLQVGDDEIQLNAVSAVSANPPSQ
jgi:flagellar basal-body rod modification protein FlgD